VLAYMPSFGTDFAAFGLFAAVYLWQRRRARSAGTGKTAPPVR
jgi:hypothetical protein